jgi:hypothetical protein
MRLGQTLQTSLFIAFLLCGSVFMLFEGGKSAVSEAENRRLAPLPKLTPQSLKSGTYLRDWENYASDHIAYRDTLVGVSKRVTYWYGLQARDNAIIVTTGANNTGDKQADNPTSEHQAERTSAPAPEPNVSSHSNGETKEPGQTAIPAVKEEEKGHIFGKVLITGDKAMNLFSYHPDAGAAYAEAINRFQSAFSQSQGASTSSYPLRTTVLLAPTAVEFVQSPKLKELSDSQRSAIHEVYEKLPASVRTVDVLPTLWSHKEEELYFRTDHHWTATGAYYAYTAYMQSLGLEPSALSGFPIEKVDGFLGSLYSATRNAQLAKHPDTIVLYKPTVPHEYVVHYKGPLKMNLLDMNHAEKKNKYRIFLSGDRPWGLITTKASGGQKIAVIKDSYGNAFIPFLVQHFSEIFIIDPRQFEQNLPEFIKNHDIHEVLFLNNVEVTMDTGFAEQLKSLLTEIKVQTVE